jgi:hypothetical protein
MNRAPSATPAPRAVRRTPASHRGVPRPYQIQGYLTASDAAVSNLGFGLGVLGVRGLGHGVLGLGFRRTGTSRLRGVQRFGIRGSGIEFRVSVSGFRAEACRFRGVDSQV